MHVVSVHGSPSSSVRVGVLEPAEQLDDVMLTVQT